MQYVVQQYNNRWREYTISVRLWTFLPIAKTHFYYRNLVSRVNVINNKKELFIVHLKKVKQNAKCGGFKNHFILKSIQCQLVPLFKWLDIHSSNIYSIVTKPQYTLTTHPKTVSVVSLHDTIATKTNSMKSRKKNKTINQISNFYDCCPLVTFVCQFWKNKNKGHIRVDYYCCWCLCVL